MKKVTVEFIDEHNVRITDALIESLDAKELMLLSFGRCACLTLAAIMKKMQIPFTAISVQTSGELTEPPQISYSTYTSFVQAFHIACPAADHSKVLHAVELTHGKYCGVGIMVSRIAPSSYKVELSER